LHDFKLKQTIQQLSYNIEAKLVGEHITFPVIDQLKTANKHKISSCFKLPWSIKIPTINDKNINYVHIMHISNFSTAIEQSNIKTYMQQKY
jgi:hypothetical protein